MTRDSSLRTLKFSNDIINASKELPEDIDFDVGFCNSSYSVILRYVFEGSVTLDIDLDEQGIALRVCKGIVHIRDSLFDYNSSSVSSKTDNEVLNRVLGYIHDLSEDPQGFVKFYKEN